MVSFMLNFHKKIQMCWKAAVHFVTFLERLIWHGFSWVLQVPDNCTLSFSGIPAPWIFLKSLEPHWFIEKVDSNVKDLPDPPISDAPLITICNRLRITDACYDRISLGGTFEYSALPGPSHNRIFSIVLSYHHPEDSALLVENLRQFCYVHPETRKIIPISGDHLKNATEHKLIRVNVLPVPARHFRYSVRVAHSDTDFFGHLNHSHYLRFCMDAAAEAAKAGALNNFTGDMFEYKLSDADLLYQAECHAGDELNIHLWEDETNRHQLHFQIKKNAQDVHFSSVTFHCKLKSNL